MKTKKVLAAFLSAAMVLTSMAVPVFADDAVASAGSAGGGTGSATVAAKGTETNPYTLDEFNKLTDISGKEVWVNIGKLDISQNSATLGNYNMSDEYKWGVYGAETPGEKYTKKVRDEQQFNRTVWMTEKSGATIHVTGELVSEKGYNNSNFVAFKTLYFQVPAESTIILENMKLSGIFNLNANYTYLYNNPDGTTADGSTPDKKAEWGTNAWYNDPIMVKNLKLEGCTINGQWFSNGNIAKNVVISNTEFKHHINTDNNNNSNPIWWKNQTSMSTITVNNSKVESSRPVKFENYIGNLSVTNNIFAMLDGNACGTTGDDNKKKNAALYINARDMGNVEILNNKIETTDGVHTQLIAYKGITLKDGAEFKIIDNTRADGKKLDLKEVINGWHQEEDTWPEEIKNFVEKSVNGKDVSVAQIGDKYYSSLKAAVAAVSDSATIKLLSDATESITIASGKDITLDLNGYTLRNEDGKHTIENYGTLTITDSSTAKTGKVDNVSNGRIPLVNYEGGKVTLNGGTFDRSLENGIVGNTDKGANSCYTIKNWGNMTINEGTVVNNKSNSVNGSSAIGNGYQNGSKFDGHKNVTADNVNVKLIINGGKFTGGLNTIKNDDYAELEINGGTFENSTQQCVLNWNITKISGGSFKAESPATCAIYNGYGDDTMDKGTLTITDGNFEGKIFVYGEKAKTSISGGLFSEDVSKYCVDKHFASKNSDGKYEVKNIEAIEAPVTSLYKKDKKTTSYATGTNYTLINDYSDNDKIVLFYTLDGSNPTTSTKRKVYNGEKLKINNAVTVKTVYMKACGECENCTAGKYSECTAPVYGQIGTYKYTVKKKNSNSDSSTGTSTRGVTYGGRKYTKDIFGVEHKSHNAYINGYADGTVKPNGNITREELATILYRVSNDASAVVASGDKFNDVSADRWSANAIEFMASKKVVNGYEDGSFKPENKLTRGEFAAMIARFANLTDTAASRTFSDVNSSYWGFKNIMALNKAGYINGYEDGTFRPGANVTRAEVMTVINKIIGRSADASYVKSLDNNKFSDLDKNAWYYVDVMEATTDHNYTLNKSGVETEWSK